MTTCKEGYDYQHVLTIPKFENFNYKNMVGAYMNNMGWLLRKDVVNLEFVSVDIFKCYCSDYSLKFHV